MSDRDRNEDTPAGEPAEGAEALSEPFDAVAAAAELEASMQGAPAADSANAEAYIASLEAEVLELNEVIARKDAEKQQADKRAIAAVDEIEAAKQRLARDGALELERRRGEVLRAFVEVLDDLDRALVGARAAEHNAEVVGGVELVHRRFLGTLERFGVQRMAVRGTRFDPALQEAVSLIPVSDPAKDGQVLEVLRAGYTFVKPGADEDAEPMVLRPATVVVGKKS